METKELFVNENIYITYISEMDIVSITLYENNDEDAEQIIFLEKERFKELQKAIGNISLMK